MTRASHLAAIILVSLAVCWPAVAQDRHEQPWSAEEWALIRISAGQIADFDLNPSCADEPEPDKNADEGWDASCRTISPEFLRDILTTPASHEAKLPGYVRIAHARISGDIDLTNAHIVPELWVVDSRVDGDVLVSGAHFDHQILFDGSHVVGQVYAEGLQADVGLSLVLTRIDEDVNFVWARIGGLLDLQNAMVTGGLSLNAAHVAGAVFFRGGVFSRRVDLIGLNVEGRIEMSGAVFVGTLVSASARIGMDLLMGCLTDQRSGDCGQDEYGEPTIGHFLGQVVLRNVKVAGQLSMSGSAFAQPVDMSGVRVGTSVLLDKSARFAKRLNLQRARIGDSLMLDTGTFTRVDLTGVAIARELRLQGDGDAANWQWDDDQPPRMILRNARVESVVDTEAAWPKDLELDLDGFVYAHPPGREPAFARTATGRSAEWWTEWLNRDRTSSTQPYAQLSVVLAASGDHGTASSVEFAGREQERWVEWNKGRCWELPPFPSIADPYGAMVPVAIPSPPTWHVERCLAWLGYSVQRHLVGYGIGYRAFWVIVWVGALWIAGIGVLLSGRATRHKGPLWCIFASLDRMLPIVELNKSFAEYLAEPSEPDGPRQYQVVYFWMHALLGWVLGLLLIAAISGIAQRG